VNTNLFFSQITSKIASCLARLNCPRMLRLRKSAVNFIRHVQFDSYT
jgi:hypothetical protein